MKFKLEQDVRIAGTVISEGSIIEVIEEKDRVASTKRSRVSYSDSSWLILIWDNSGTLLTHIVCDNMSDARSFEHRKGELADFLEETFKSPMNPEDFEAEVISYPDFIDEYGNAKNPNPIGLRNGIEY